MFSHFPDTPVLLAVAAILIAEDSAEIYYPALQRSTMALSEARGSHPQLPASCGIARPVLRVELPYYPTSRVWCQLAGVFLLYCRQYFIPGHVCRWLYPRLRVTFQGQTLDICRTLLYIGCRHCCSFTKRASDIFRAQHHRYLVESRTAVTRVKATVARNTWGRLGNLGRSHQSILDRKNRLGASGF